MPDIARFPEYFEGYEWNNKHHLYGYPADSFENFSWITSLEQRFEWLKNNHARANTASIYLVREMIQWGGSQNGVLQKFDDRIGEINLYECMKDIIGTLENTNAAIEKALKMPGMGLTYSSKLLRFLDPEKYGALDNRVRKAIEKHAGEIEIKIPDITDGNVNSMIKGYSAFINYVEWLKGQLENAGIARPACALPRGNSETGWRAADVEMALFRWAELADNR
jgi:hypothetical protein